MGQIIKQRKLMHKEHFVALLRTIISHIQDDDSYEGCLEYTTYSPIEYDEIPNDHFEVYAMIRVGNSMGQGGSMGTVRVEEIPDE